MTAGISPGLEMALSALRELPEAAQRLIVSDILLRANELSELQLSDARRDVVRQRLTEPAKYADDAEVAVLFRRHRIGG